MNNKTGLQQLIAGEEAKRRRTATVIALLPQGRAVEMTTLYEKPTFHRTPILASLTFAASIGGLLWVLL